MRTALSLATALMLFAAPAIAGDTHVPQTTLAAVGLADMEVMTDVQGNEVRGMSGWGGNSMAMGLSLVSGLIVDPTTKSFVFGADVNAAMASGSNAQSSQFSAINLNLIIAPSVTSPGFAGTIFGGAGGSAFASSF